MGEVREGGENLSTLNCIALEVMHVTSTCISLAGTQTSDAIYLWRGGVEWGGMGTGKCSLVLEPEEENFLPQYVMSFK